MIISIISEPRSGSYNLYKWMAHSIKGFNILFESAKDGDVFYSQQWFDCSKNYIVHDKYSEGNYDNMIRLVNSSDITIALYREDEEKQIESFTQSVITNHWNGWWIPKKYIINEINSKYLQHKVYFENLKKGFKIFRSEYNLKTFTYEDLYYRNKIDEFKEYIGIDIDTPFPYGNKYRIDTPPERLL